MTKSTRPPCDTYTRRMQKPSPRERGGFRAGRARDRTRDGAPARGARHDRPTARPRGRGGEAASQGRASRLAKTDLHPSPNLPSAPFFFRRRAVKTRFARRLGGVCRSSSSRSPRPHSARGSTRSAPARIRGGRHPGPKRAVTAPRLIPAAHTSRTRQHGGLKWKLTFHAADRLSDGRAHPQRQAGPDAPAPRSSHSAAPARVARWARRRSASGGVATPGEERRLRERPHGEGSADRSRCKED